jgi:nanoRNase/pAp phosphatase (c-di-AMP/oligoRNAs hydrolase)
VSDNARRHDGGGHFIAAGFSVKGNLDAAREIVDKEAEAALK